MYPTQPGNPSQTPLILVPTDLSDLDRLISYAFQFAQQWQARLLLLHVITPQETIHSDPLGMPCADLPAAFSTAEQALEPWRSLAAKRGIVCNTLVREGQPAAQIVSTAHQLGVDCVVLGTRSRSRLSRLLLGSVAEQVLRSVNSPVITVGPEAHLEVAGNCGHEPVLYATTLRETSRPGAALACRIAATLHKPLTLLHIVEPLGSESVPEIFAREAEAGKKLDTLASDIATTTTGHVPVDARLACGSAAVEILAAASEANASLIVLGATPRSAWSALGRNGTVYRVLAHARCPVLTLRTSVAAEWSTASAGQSHIA